MLRKLNIVAAQTAARFPTSSLSPFPNWPSEPLRAVFFSVLNRRRCIPRLRKKRTSLPSLKSWKRKPSHLATWARATNGRTAEEGRGDGQTRDRDKGPMICGKMLQIAWVRYLYGLLLRRRRRCQPAAHVTRGSREAVERLAGANVILRCRGAPVFSRPRPAAD